ncbi:MAG: glycosyltransferase [Desulfovibrionaceae bacterium]
MYYPIFSIIVSFEENRFSLKETLDSIIMQSYPHWEVLVVKNEMVKGEDLVTLDAYKKGDARIKSISTHLCSASALNYALSHAKGEWISFLSVGSSYMQDRLSILIQKTFETPSSLFFYSAFQVQEDTGEVQKNKNILNTLNVISLLQQDSIAFSSVFIHNAVFSSVGAFNENIEYAYEYELLLRIAKDTTMEYINEITCSHRVYEHGRNKSAPYSTQFDIGRIGIEFLQKYKLSEIAPHAKDSADSAKEFLAQVLSVAMYEDSVIYGCGIHTVLFTRLTQWLVKDLTSEVRTTVLASAMDIIGSSLNTLPFIMQDACANLLRVNVQEYQYQMENIYVVLAKAGGELLKTKPSIAILFMHYYQNLFPEVYSSMLLYFTDANAKTADGLYYEKRRRPVHYEKNAQIENKHVS